MKRLLFILTIGVVTIQYSNAQVDLEGTLRAGLLDARTYLKNYMEPAILSFANGLSNGWVNTAETHKMWGFDLTLSVNVATVPDDVLQFSYAAQKNWQNLEFVSGNDRIPTSAGGEASTKLRIKKDAVIRDPATGKFIKYTGSSAPFDAAPGIDVSDFPFAGIPTPTVNLSIGLMKKTDLKIRYMPIKTGDFEVDMFGVGIMHDIKQWIPGLQLVPIDIAGFLGYTAMNVKADFEIEQPAVGDTNGLYTEGPASSEFKFKISSTTIQLLASKKFSVFTPYISLGYNIVNSNFDVLGTYVYTNDDADILRIKNPISIKFSEGNSPRATIGARLKLLVLTFHADYTFQNYNTFTAGIGISVR